MYDLQRGYNSVAGSRHRYARAMGARLELETAAARIVAAASRATGRGGGTTLPGKLLWKVDPGALDALSRRLDQGVALVSATNGKTTTTAMVASIMAKRFRLAWNHSGANLASGVTSALLAARKAELGVIEVDEFALPEIMRRTQPRVVALGNLFRDQLDRYGELEHIAERWREAVLGLPHSAVLVVNGDDPLVASLASGRERVVRYGIDDPGVARPALQHAADSKYCLACGRPYEYAAAYVGHLGEYRCPGCGVGRAPLDVAAHDIALDGLVGSSFTLKLPSARVPVTLRVPGLYNVYNAASAASVAAALGVPADDIREGLEAFRPAFGRFERVTVGGTEVVILLVKNPAGANEAVRTLRDGGVPRVLLVALNDAIADGRDVSWIWDVDFEPLLEEAEHLVLGGERAEELALRFTYAGYPADRLELVRPLEAALDRALERAGGDERIAVLPTYTAMLGLQRILSARGLTRPYWEGT
jgi:UDP-N-acetylmuramyl tripeptide synthase